MPHHGCVGDGALQGNEWGYVTAAAEVPTQPQPLPPGWHDHPVSLHTWHFIIPAEVRAAGRRRPAAGSQRCRTVWAGQGRHADLPPPRLHRPWPLRAQEGEDSLADPCSLPAVAEAALARGAASPAGAPGAEAAGAAASAPQTLHPPASPVNHAHGLPPAQDPASAFDSSKHLLHGEPACRQHACVMEQQEGRRLKWVYQAPAPLA